MLHHPVPRPAGRRWVSLAAAERAAMEPQGERSVSAPGAAFLGLRGVAVLGARAGNWEVANAFSKP